MRLLGLVLAAAASMPSPADLPTVPRLIQTAQPLYCAGTRGRNFALTFDDGPSPYTLQLVRVLKRAHARATFFDVGSRVEFWPSAVRASVGVGELGNHTWTHAHLLGLSMRQTLGELVRTQRALGREVGAVPRLFRPPYDEARPADELLARQLNLLDVRWSVDTGDSRPGAVPRTVVRAAIAGLRPGAIILLHDPHPWTPRVARRVLRAARKKHLRPVTVSDLLGRQPPSARQLASTGGTRCPGSLG
jgi:peptidoglycan/xylan/chitin deacetylase (PgdA/CDA1 family)